MHSFKSSKRNNRKNRSTKRRRSQTGTQIDETTVSIQPAQPPNKRARINNNAAKKHTQPTLPFSELEMESLAKNKVKMTLLFIEMFDLIHL